MNPITSGGSIEILGYIQGRIYPGGGLHASAPVLLPPPDKKNVSLVYGGTSRPKSGSSDVIRLTNKAFKSIKIDFRLKRNVIRHIIKFIYFMI